MPRRHHAVFHAELLDQLARLARKRWNAVLHRLIVGIGGADHLVVIFEAAAAAPDLVGRADAVTAHVMGALVAAIDLADLVGGGRLAVADLPQIAQPPDLRGEPRTGPNGFRE